MNKPQTPKPEPDTSNPKENKGTSVWQVIQSTLAGLFGIQSEKNRQKDFKQGSMADYILAGVVGVVILLIGMAVLVSSVIESSSG